MSKNSGEKRGIKAKLFNRKQIRDCHYCGVGITMQTATLEHLRPKSQKGSFDRNNLALSCKSCNQARGSSDYIAFKAKMLPVKQERLNLTKPTDRGQ